MNEIDNVFDISDYGMYFDSSAVDIVDIPVDDIQDIGVPATDALPPDADETELPAEPDNEADTSDIPSSEINESLPPPDADEVELPVESGNETDGEVDTEIITETPVIVEEPEQSVTLGTIDYTKQFEDVNVHLKNIESLSIVILVAVGIFTGINILKILLDRFWR